MADEIRITRPTWREAIEDAKKKMLEVHAEPRRLTLCRRVAEALIGEIFGIECRIDNRLPEHVFYVMQEDEDDA